MYFFVDKSRQLIYSIKIKGDNSNEKINNKRVPYSKGKNK